MEYFNDFLNQKALSRGRNAGINCRSLEIPLLKIKVSDIYCFQYYSNLIPLSKKLNLRVTLNIHFMNFLEYSEMILSHLLPFYEYLASY